MNKDKRIQELKELVQRFETDYSIYVDSSNNYNEQMTRQQYIDVFLRLLGWDISNPLGLSFNEREVVAEEFSISGKKDRPDYTIRMNGVSKFFVEAKKVSVKIDSEQSPALQARRYGWNVGHDISILTNFEYLAIYLTHSMPKDTDNASWDRYKLYHYRDFVNKFDEIYKLISRESMLNGYFEKWTSEIKPEDATKLSLDSIFLNQLNQWRLMIAKDLYNKIKDIEEYGNLNELIQVFLNQLIFLRFAEDNRFENADMLKKEVLKHNNYVEYFKKLDKKYNSELFKDPLVINNLSYEILSDVVENLYFPNVSYDFSIIDLSILSKIYENFLQQEIIIENNEVYLEKTKNAKIKAVVSTPNDLVVAMVHRVLKDKLLNKTPKEVLDLKIADLAVGSGIFLIEVYNYIENYLVDFYAKEKNVYPNLDIVPFEMKRKIVENVLWGFDINNQAIQITRFSLLLRLLSNEKEERVKNNTPILPSLTKTIICGNSLISDNDVDILSLDENSLYEVSPLDKNVLSNVKFDVVIGNPPYLKIEDIKKSTPQIEVDTYKDKYISAHKQYDKYFLFIEKTIQLLKDDGEAILLVPNKFFTIGAGIKLRELLNKLVYRVYDFNVTQIFKGVVNYVSVIQISSGASNRLHYTKVNSSEDIYKDKNGVEHDFSMLDRKHWFLSDDEEFKNKYEFCSKNFPNILEEIDPVNGVQTSKNNVYIIPKSKVVSDDKNIISFNVNKEEFSIEKELLREFYLPKKNHKGESYQNLEADNYIIFPYSNGNIISSIDMQNNYPNTWKYFNTHKQELLPKIMGGKRDVQGNDNNIEWYQYGRTQYLKEVDNDKIIVGVMSKEPNFNIDRNNFVFSSGGTAGYIGLFMKDNSKYTLEFIQAWLSHNFTDTIFKTIGSDFEGGFYTHGTNMYDAIPLLPIDFDSKQEVSIFNNINDCVKRISELNTKIELEKEKKKKELNGRVKIELVDRINSLIDNLIEMKMRTK